jgi:SAM-dependent methyltransferase
MSETPDPDTQRAEMLAGWERAARGWSNRADSVRDSGMPVSLRMIEQLSPQPGQRVLELAAGPGDTGFLAAELIKPGGTLICSDGADAMLEVARSRAARFGIDNVEFAHLQLEWIDLPTASVDAVLCRWGLMLSLDPAAAASEVRRVLRPGGRLAVAVWSEPAENPWATIPSRAMLDAGLSEPPEPGTPGMFALAQPGALSGLLESGGFVDVVVEKVEVRRQYSDTDAYIAETLDLSQMFSRGLKAASEAQRAGVLEAIAIGVEPFVSADGTIELPGSSLVAAASA